MKKLLFGVLITLLVWASLPGMAQENLATNLLISSDGRVSIRAPQDWYLSLEETDTQSRLIATETPERAANWQGAGDLIVQVYIDDAYDANTILSKTVKDHQLGEVTWAENTISVWGLSGTEYSGASDDIQARMLFIPLPDSDTLVRTVAIASPDGWDTITVDSIFQSLVILPQVANVPKGWNASIRAPLGWEQREFSSFVQWIAPDSSPLRRTEVWFQAGFRQDLIGQGEAPFVLRSLGVNYVQQVDESSSIETLLGGLPANTLPFESFTHSGFSYHAIGGTDFGTANLVARAPLGEWTATHQLLVEAMAASVQILPPTADNAPVGLRTGYRAPAFQGTFFDGTPFALSDFEGDLVFVHFWFVDCPYCRTENPHLQAVHAEYQDDGLVILAINAIDSPDYITSFMQSEGYSFPVVLDNGSLHDQFQVTAFPTTFVVGPDGVIVQTARGPLSEQSMRNLVAQYLLGG